MAKGRDVGGEGAWQTPVLDLEIIKTPMCAKTTR
jgi:hypothetical protein